jgi:negative regulator of flagellin synthesis FlgM
MKITSNQAAPVDPQRSTASSAPAGKTAANSSSSANSGATKVAVSDAASSLSSTSADFNAQKVASVSAAIANGTYQVNASSIADKMLSGVSEMSKKR